MSYNAWMLQSYSFTPYSIPALISALITLMLAVTGFRRTTVPSARCFAVLMLCSFVWAGGTFLMLGSPDLSGKIFWFNIAQVGASFTPVLWLFFALHYSGKETRLNRKRIAGLLVFPAATILLIWTNSYHQLVRKDIALKAAGRVIRLAIIRGPWFYLEIIFYYFLLSAAFILLLKIFRQASTEGHSVLKRQVSFILLSLLIPVFSNILDIAGINPLRAFGSTVVAFAFSGLIIAYALFRFKLFDLAPVAREKIIHNMKQAMAVVDPSDRIIDYNPAFLRLVQQENEIAGTGAGKFFPEWDRWIHTAHPGGEAVFTFNTNYGSDKRFYNAAISPLYDRKNSIIGNAVIFYDITALKAAEEKTKQLLEEKDILLKEVHHRIKNNMSTIAGLLSLQAHAVDEESAKKALNETRGRVRSMMVIYDKLYRSKDFRRISSEGYFSRLVHEIFSTFSLRGRVGLSIEADDILLDAEHLFPLGIIINEILTNSLKYAFPEGAEGRISVSFHKTGADRLELFIGDNGKGMEGAATMTAALTSPAAVSETAESVTSPAAVSETAESVTSPAAVHPSKGFGLTLVDVMVKQLHADIAVFHGQGIGYRISFSAGNCSGGVSRSPADDE